MMANMRMAKKRRRPICSRGIMAFMMDLSTTCKPVGYTQRWHLVEVKYHERESSPKILISPICYPLPVTFSTLHNPSAVSEREGIPLSAKAAEAHCDHVAECRNKIKEAHTRKTEHVSILLVFRTLICLKNGDINIMFAKIFNVAACIGAVKWTLATWLLSRIPQWLFWLKTCC